MMSLSRLEHNCKELIEAGFGYVTPYISCAELMGILTQLRTTPTHNVTPIQVEDNGAGLFQISEVPKLHAINLGDGRILRYETNNQLGYLVGLHGINFPNPFHHSNPDYLDFQEGLERGQDVRESDTP
ncbi:hypothetical protein D3C87_616200 [compost metagenome]